MAVGDALTAWVGHHDALGLTLEAAGCAWIGAKGSNLPFVDADDNSEDLGLCRMNGSEFVGALLLASMGAQCTEDQLDELTAECGLEGDDPTGLAQVRWWNNCDPEPSYVYSCTTNWLGYDQCLVEDETGCIGDRTLDVIYCLAEGVDCYD